MSLFLLFTFQHRLRAYLKLQSLQHIDSSRLSCGVTACVQCVSLSVVGTVLRCASVVYCGCPVKAALRFQSRVCCCRLSYEHKQQRFPVFIFLCLESPSCRICQSLSSSASLVSWHPTPVLLPGKSHGRRSLVGYSPWQRYKSDTTEQLYFHALEKEVAAHSSVIAWRIPGTRKPDGLLSMGSHRVGHD